jgi:hypothetical protein
MAREKYQRIVVGYHGCDAAVVERVLAGKVRLSLSSNAYDWLGEGIYFWEHGPRRAYEWAIEQARLGAAKVKNPSLLAARIDLGVCLDLLGHGEHAAIGQMVRQLPPVRPAEGSPVAAESGCRWQSARGQGAALQGLRCHRLHAT